MRVMVIVKAAKESESGALPKEAELKEMNKFNAELVKAGVMLAAEGLRASSTGNGSGSPAPSKPFSMDPSVRPRSSSLASGSGK